MKKLGSENKGSICNDLKNAYESLINNQVFGLVIIQEDHIVFSNQTISDMIGYTSNELYALNPQEIQGLIHEKDRGQAWKILKAKFANKDSKKKNEFQFIHKDGSIITIELHGTLIEYEDKPAIQVIAFDIVEKNNVKKALKACENRFHKLAELIPAIYVEMDLKGILTYVNQYGFKISGYSKKDFKKGFKASDLFIPEDRGRVQENVKRLMMGEKLGQNEYTAVRKDGTFFNVLAQSSPILEDNNIVGLRSILFDITTRKEIDNTIKESEERYRHVTEATQDTIYDWDIVNDVSKRNTSYFELYDPPKDSSHDWWKSNIHSDDQHKIIHRLNDLFLGKDDRWEEEYRFRNSKGEYLNILDRGFVLRDSEGQPQRMIGAMSNITKRKKAENALKESEEKYRQLVENINDVIFKVDKEGLLSYISPAIETISGYKPEEIIGKNYLEFIHEDDIPYLIDIFPQVLNGKLQPSEYRIKTKHGKIRWVRTYSRAIIEDGSPVGLQGVLTDINERKLVEQKFIENEKMHEIIFNNTNIGLALLDKQGKIIKTNKRLTDYSGYASDELDGKDYNLLEIFPEKSLKKLVNAFESILTKKQTEKVEVEAITKNYDNLIVEITGAPVVINDEVDSVVVSIRDITDWKLANEALQKSEEKFRVMSENIPVAVYSALPDEHSTNLFISGRMKELTGYSSKQFMMNPRLWNDIIHTDDRENVWNEIKNHRKKNSHLNVEYRINTKDKKVKWIRDNATPLLDDSGKIIRIDGFMEDITQRRAAEQKIIEERNHAELYMDILTHDINNLNQAIMLSSEILTMKQEIPNQYKKYVIKLYQQSLAISNLISNVRKLTDLKEKSSKKKKVEVSKIIKESIKRILKIYPDNKVKINQLHIKDKIYVKADELLLDVFDNIFNNSIKFNQNDEVVIDVLPKFTEDGAFLKIEVKDNGPGIPDQMKQNIFKRMERGDESVHGSGLGLTIVNEIINSYGGEVWVENNVEGDHTKGSNFVLMLPKV